MKIQYILPLSLMFVCVPGFANAAETWKPIEGSWWEGHIIDGVQVGARNTRTGEYWAYDPPTDTWSRSRTAPAMIASPGLVRGKLGDRETWKLDGVEVSKAQAEAMLVSNETWRDDRNAISLTVIGRPEECTPLARDLSTRPELQALRPYYVLQMYDPSDPMIRGCGFVTGGRPTIYAQTPDGAVLWRADQYDGPGPLAKGIRKAVAMFEGLRRRRPDYQPKDDASLIDFLNPRRAIYRAIGAMLKDAGILALIAGLAWLAVRALRDRFIGEPASTTTTTTKASRQKSGK